MGDSQQVGAHSDQGRLCLETPQDLKQSLPFDVVIQPRIQIVVHPAGAFDCKELVECEAGFLDFESNLLGTMEVRGRKPFRTVGRVVMDAVRQIAIDDGRECRLPERTLLDAVTRRREPGDVRGHNKPARNEDPSSFGECSETVAPFNQVIQRTKQEDNVESCVRHVKLPCITEIGTGQRRLRRSRQCPSPLDVARYWVDEMDLITTSCQRERVNASTSADIQHSGRRRGEMPLDDLPCAQLFKSPDGGLEPPFFHPVSVVIQNFGSEHRDSVTEGSSGVVAPRS